MENLDVVVIYIHITYGKYAFIWGLLHKRKEIAICVISEYPQLHISNFCVVIGIYKDYLVSPIGVTLSGLKYNEQRVCSTCGVLVRASAAVKRHRDHTTHIKENI